MGCVMILEELFEINGIQHIRRYSNSGVKIASDDGIAYDVAEDLASIGKSYTETDIPIESDESAEEIVSILLGGE